MLTIIKLYWYTFESLSESLIIHTTFAPIKKIYLYMYVGIYLFIHLFIYLFIYNKTSH